MPSGPPLHPAPPSFPPPHQPPEALMKRECVVCYDKEPTMVQSPWSKVMIPCGHVCACDDCAEFLRHCPMCRAPVYPRVPTCTHVYPPWELVQRQSSTLKASVPPPLPPPEHERGYMPSCQEGAMTERERERDERLSLSLSPTPPCSCEQPPRTNATSVLFSLFRPKYALFKKNLL